MSFLVRLLPSLGAGLTTGNTGLLGSIFHIGSSALSSTAKITEFILLGGIALLYFIISSPSSSPTSYQKPYYNSRYMMG
jgi:hypothetical protein